MFKKEMVVAVKVNGKIMREAGPEHNEVFIPFGSEYSLLLKNKSSKSAVVKVEIDGEDALSGNSLLIGANEEIELERFVERLDKGNRLKFIQKTEQIQQHRGDRIDDGIIRIEFQYEKANIIEPSIFRNCSRYSGDGRMTKSYDCSLDYFTPQSAKPQEDEGITVRGSQSNQSFRRVNVGELEPEKHTIVFKLRGITDKNDVVTEPVTVKTKVECQTCGKKSKYGTAYCSACGTRL